MKTRIACWLAFLAFVGIHAGISLAQDVRPGLFIMPATVPQVVYAYAAALVGALLLVYAYRHRNDA